MSVQKRFAKEWNMPLSTVRRLVRLSKIRKNCAERACNGDAHNLACNLTDKDECSKLWQQDADEVHEKIVSLVVPYGFGVVYTGLGPTLKYGNQYVEVPYE